MKLLNYAKLSCVAFLSMCSFFTKSSFVEKANTSKDIVYCNPIKNITIDGSVSDWPKSTRKYPIDVALFKSEANENDFSAYFMAGYHEEENALYLAVVTQDNEFVLGSEDDNLNVIDAYLLYLDEQHLKKGSGISRYVLAENQQHCLDASVNWDPKMKTLATWDRIHYKTEIRGNTKVYELKIVLESPIYEGRTIGISHMINDKDATDREIYAWNRQPSHIIARPVNLGTLVFQQNNNFGYMEGRVFWKDTLVQNLNPSGVYAISKTDARKWFYMLADRETGTFKATLPQDEYELQPGKSAYFFDDFYKIDPLNTVDFKIQTNETTANVNLALEYLETPNLAAPTNLLVSLEKESTQTKLNDIIKSYMEYYQIEGVSFTAFKGDKIYSKVYGEKNKYTQENVTDDTLFEAASMTKTIFAYTVMRLYEKGVIDLDAPLYKQLPFEKSSNTAYNKLLTARNILSHKSGLPNWGNSSDITYKFEPGTAFGYSGEAFEYLKRVLEKITDKDINTILKEEVIEPLKLENMYFKTDETAMKHKAHGHLNGLAIRKDMQSEIGVSHSLVTNSKSLAKFIMALQQRKGLLPETFDIMFSKQTQLSKENSSNIWDYNEYISFGFFIEEAPFGKVIKHGGSNGDFWATFRLYDDLNMGYIIMTNGNSGQFIRDNIERNLINPLELAKRE